MKSSVIIIVFGKEEDVLSTDLTIGMYLSGNDESVRCVEVVSASFKLDVTTEDGFKDFEEKLSRFGGLIDASSGIDESITEDFLGGECTINSWQ